MALALRIKTRFKFSILSAVSGFISYFWGTDAVNTTTEIIDSGGDSERTIFTGRCYNFDGVDDRITIGNVTTAIKTFCFKIRPNDITAHTDYLLDFNGTDYITIVNGTVTLNGFAGATTNIYVNGSASSTIPNITDFHSVIVTSDTGISCSAFEIGRLSGTGFYGGKICDYRMFSTELSAGERTTVDNYGIELTGLISWFKMDEQAGIIAYDSVNNRYTSTIINSTASTFFAVDHKVGFSWLNEYGYSILGSTTIPRNEMEITEDVLTNTLEETGRVKFHADLVGSNCITLDGLNDSVEIGDISASATEIVFYTKLIVDNQMLFSLQGSAATGVYVAADVLTFGASLTVTEIQIDDVVKTASQAGVILNDNTWHKVKLTLSSISVSNLRLGTAASTNGNISLAHFKINTTDGEWPLAEGRGFACYDISGNGKHGVATNVSEGNFWGNTQDLIHTNIINGCSTHMYFDGTDDYVQNTTSFPDITAAGTIFLRVKLETLVSDHVPIAIRNTNNNHISIEVKSSGVVYCRVYDGTVNNFSTSSKLTAGAINTLAVVINSATDVDIYIDAVENTDGTFGGPVAIQTGISLGSNNGLSPINGIIYDMAIYSTALTGANISALHNKTSLPTDLGAGSLEAYWINKGKDDVFWTDQSGNSYDGTVSGSPLNLYLPALSSGVENAIGDSILNPAGNYHNNSETKFQLPAAPKLISIDVNNYFFDANNDPIALGYGDFVKDESSEHKIMMDVSVVNQYKNLLIYETALSGDDLTTTQEFLNH